MIYNNLYDIYKSKLDEICCILKKTYLQHWALKNIEQEFIVSNKNTWDPHPVNLLKTSTLSKNYYIMAESERGPQIAIHKNSLVCQFHIELKYPQTVQILTNFIRQHLILIQNSHISKLGMKIDEAEIYEKTAYYETKDETLKIAAQVAKQKGMEKIRRALLDKHISLRSSEGYSHSGNIYIYIYI